MGVKQTVIKTITCDKCGNKITDEECQKLFDALEVPTGYFMDQVSKANLNISRYWEPYSKFVKNPIFCKDCTIKVLTDALSKLGVKTKEC